MGVMLWMMMLFMYSMLPTTFFLLVNDLCGPDIILIKNGGGNDSNKDKTVLVTLMNCMGIDGQQLGMFQVASGQQCSLG